MDSRLIHKTSEKLQQKIDWIKPAETEWIYCGSDGEVRFAFVAKELDNFLDGSTFYVATTRSGCFESGKENLLLSISNLVGSTNFFIWNDGFKKVVEFSEIGVFRKGVLVPA